MLNAVRVQTRSLGYRTRGPAITDLPSNYLYAKQFFKGGSLTYPEFKQQCMSLRIFAFGGLVAFFTAKLITDPLKSSYWMTWSPLKWPGHAIGLISARHNEVFLSEKRPESEGISVMDAYTQLTLKRRLDSDVAED